MLGAFHNILTTGSQRKGFRYINTTFLQIQHFYKYHIFTNTTFLQIQLFYKYNFFTNTTFLQIQNFYKYKIFTNTTLYKYNIFTGRAESGPASSRNRGSGSQCIRAVTIVNRA